MQPTNDWLELWRKERHKTKSPVNFEPYFARADIAGKRLDTLRLGNITVPSGSIVVCDPLYFLNRDAEEYFLPAPKGVFPVEAAVIQPDIYDCARFAAMRVIFSDMPPAYYEEALTGHEDLSGFEAGEFFGFNVESGLACICDATTRDAASDFITLWYNEHPNENIYDDYFAGLFVQSAIDHPRYQREVGDWLSWRVPGTDLCMPLCQSGFGDGVYPVYFGFNEYDEVCQLVVHFIDMEMVFSSASNDD